jgi:Dolichyl-phosphate-mannose-protein mannosyltransferase
MTRAIAPLLGALFTVVTAWSLGMLLLRRLAVVLHKWEERLLAFVAGSVCLSAVMFVLSATRLVHRGVLVALALAIIGYAAYSGAFRSAAKPFPPLPRSWGWVFWIGFAVFTVLGFFTALAPEHSTDGMAYHLGVLLHYQRAHGFPRITTDIYANLSEGIELLYLFAFDFGRHSAASLVHFTFLVTLVFLILSYGKRISRPAVGVAAALFTYACPVVMLDATMAYIDVALAAVVFALFYLLQIWDENRDPKLLVLIGLLAGFCYEIKYTAFVAVPYAVGFVAWKLWRERKPVLKPVLVVSLIAVCCILPWMLKNWIEVANPVSPIANRLFPNPYVHISFEETWRKDLTTYTLPSRWQIPLQITVQGDLVEGFLGPLFLLAPLGLLALRYRPGRQVLLAAAIFACTYFTNIGTRFLIPSVPFVALAMALVAADIQWLLPTLVILNCVLCLPPIYNLYVPANGYRIDKVRWREALRIKGEEAYLSEDPEYAAAHMIGYFVPSNEPIFAISQGGQAYLPRTLLVGYESASNELLEDILWTPVVRAFQPSRILKFDFAPRQLRKLRIVQTARLPNNQWSMAEVRIFNGPMELPRNPGWVLTAHPNPWDVQLAFDNSPVTRWRSWQSAEPGMYVEVDFQTLQEASSVVVESSDDSGDIKLKLEGMGADGAWVTLSDRPVQSRQPIHVSLRLAATAEFKARGIHYVIVKPDDPGFDDMRRYAAYWGFTLVGTSGDRRLFHIN